MCVVRRPQRETASSYGPIPAPPASRPTLQALPSVPSFLPSAYSIFTKHTDQRRRRRRRWGENCNIDSLFFLLLLCFSPDGGGPMNFSFNVFSSARQQQQQQHSYIYKHFHRHVFALEEKVFLLPVRPSVLPSAHRLSSSSAWALLKVDLQFKDSYLYNMTHIALAALVRCAKVLLVSSCCVCRREGTSGAGGRDVDPSHPCSSFLSSRLSWMLAIRADYYETFHSVCVCVCVENFSRYLTGSIIAAT